MSRKSGILCSLLFSVMMWGCSFDYQEAMVEGEKRDSLPDTVVTGYTHTVFRGGVRAYQIEAEQAETYGEKNITILTNTVFREFDSTGMVVTRGEGDRIVYHTDTDNAELEGDLLFYSKTQEATIRADALEWRDKEERLTAPTESTVSIRTDAGSWVEGKGFRVLVPTREVFFEGSVKGEYVTE